MSVETLTWTGCYADSWKGFITSKSFAHPAKFSCGLVRRILAFGLERGFWRAGDLIGDPFGGVATGGLCAAYAGLRWVGVELEPKFAEMARDNIELHRFRLEKLACPVPVIVQGDSRQFAELVRPAGLSALLTSPPYAGSPIPGSVPQPGGRQGVRSSYKAAGSDDTRDCYGQTPGQIGQLQEGALDAALSSPPYAESIGRENNIDYSKGTTPGGGKKPSPARDAIGGAYGETDGQIGALPQGSLDGAITSPPYAANEKSDYKINDEERTRDRDLKRGFHQGAGCFRGSEAYGDTDGQIGRLREGGLDAVITSPPYAECVQGDHGEQETAQESQSKRQTPGGSLGQSQRHGGYGVTDGQIGALKEGVLDGAVTSPPYENSMESGDKMAHIDFGKTFDGKDHRGKGHGCQGERSESYGLTDGQIGLEEKKTYWRAMRDVYRQCWLALKPGRVLCCVVKDYIRDGQRVPLVDQTCCLLEAVGFQSVPARECPAYRGNTRGRTVWRAGCYNQIAQELLPPAAREEAARSED